MLGLAPDRGDNCLSQDRLPNPNENRHQRSFYPFLNLSLVLPHQIPQIHRRVTRQGVLTGSMVPHCVGSEPKQHVSSDLPSLMQL